jgi:hypothetical protein
MSAFWPIADIQTALMNVGFRGVKRRTQRRNFAGLRRWRFASMGVWAVGCSLLQIDADVARKHQSPDRDGHNDDQRDAGHDFITPRRLF